MLEDERSKAENLATRLQHAEEHGRTAAARLEEAERGEREAHEKSREHVNIVSLQSTTSHAEVLHFCRTVNLILSGALQVKCGHSWRIGTRS